MADLTFFATCPKGMEELLADELRALGAGVSWRGPLESAYSACLWSRLASRVLLHLTDFRAADVRRLYDGVRRLDWSEHLDPAGTLAVEVTAAHPPADLRHTHFVAQKVKDAIVDQFRERCGERPSVDVRRPDVRANVHLAGEAATLSLDLSGESLHRRGYRQEGRQVEAPLKENLAAAVLVRAGWSQLGGRGGSPATLVDPLCGSGTLLIEGAWMAADIAPGLLRAESGGFGFPGWKQHDAEAWDALARTPVALRSSWATTAIRAL